MKNNICISIAIPIHNEESVLPELLRRCRNVLDQIPGGPHEIVIVDDGSSDHTLQILEEESLNDPRMIVVSLSRNFGHQAALSAALDHVSGDVTVLMDGDLQDPPEAVPVFLSYHEAGYDVVYARRVQRKESWWLRLCYFLFYRLLQKLSAMPLPLDSGDFGLISNRVVQQLRTMPEHHRYLRGMRSWIGFRQLGVEVERSERHSGESKYTLRKLLKLASDGLFAFSIVPLRAAAFVGMCALTLSFVFALYALYAKLFLNQSPRGFTALTILIIFLSGAHLFFLGVIGEYVGRIYEESKRRPLYVVSKLIKAHANESRLLVKHGSFPH